MKQPSLGLNLLTKKTCKREFQKQMNKVVPWDVPVQIVASHYPKVQTGRPPFAMETMLRIHCLQQFGLSDPAMEEALHDDTELLRPKRKEYFSERQQAKALEADANKQRKLGLVAPRPNRTDDHFATLGSLLT